MKKQAYTQPEIELLKLQGEPSLLVDFSVGGSLDDIEDAGEWDDNAYAPGKSWSSSPHEESKERGALLHLG